MHTEIIEKPNRKSAQASAEDNILVRYAFDRLEDGAAFFDVCEKEQILRFANTSFFKLADIRQKSDEVLSLNMVLMHLIADGHIQIPKFIADARHQLQLYEWKHLSSHYHLSLSVIKNKGFENEVYILSLKDITDQKLREDKISQHQKLEALGQLAGGVAHDFNNILSIIDGYSRMALKTADIHDIPQIRRDEMASHISKIRDAAKRGAEITKQLLMFGAHRITGKKTTNLDELLQQQRFLMKPLLSDQVELKFDIDERINIECVGDELSRVIMNLLVNARDAMPDGGRITIKAHLLSEDALSDLQRQLSFDFDTKKTYAKLAITDTGIGMDENTLARIYDPFFTTKEQGKGTGLGMSMVFGFVREMGGVINVTSVLGEGTVMALYLPVAKPSVKRNFTSSSEMDEKFCFDGYTVMLAEDEPDLLAIMKDTLEDMGFSVLAAQSGDEALELQEDYEGDIDFLITDIVMPGLDGVKLAELFLALREETSVIFVSGFPASGKLSGIQIPENAVLLAKPVESQSLVRLMRNMIVSDGDMGNQDENIGQWQNAAV